jgi:DNA-binding NarL/FixJ family response regulator
MIRVLLIDDHPVVRSGYQRLLDQDGGVQVVCEASHAAEGLRLFEAYRPDVTITDLSMPDVGGLQLLADILQLDPMAKVLVCSMFDTPHLVQNAMERGAQGFVSKNASPENLVNAVYAAFRGEVYLSDDLRDKHHHADDEKQRVASLTPRELDILRLLALGHTAAECAQALSLSLKTVANNQTVIKEKLGVSTSAALVHLAQRHGIIQFK